MITASFLQNSNMEITLCFQIRTTKFGSKKLTLPSCNQIPLAVEMGGGGNSETELWV
jgi:hypothetical protein